MHVFILTCPVYVLATNLDLKERWLCAGFKRPNELRRWALAGYDKWGLAEEFEPMRRFVSVILRRLNLIQP